VPAAELAAANNPTRLQIHRIAGTAARATESVANLHQRRDAAVPKKARLYKRGAAMQRSIDQFAMRPLNSLVTLA
jgi:hypothetical protein